MMEHKLTLHRDLGQEISIDIIEYFRLIHNLSTHFNQVNHHG